MGFRLLFVLINRESSSVKRFLSIAAMFVVLALFATPAMAADGASITFSGAFGAGIVTLGAALGIGKIASAALDSMARQPEIAGNAQTAMIIAAALIEGFTFFALYICMTQNPWANL